MGKIKKNNFYKWAYSDLLTNIQRGILAEYIVSTALGIDNKPRIEWDEYDLEYNNLKIEVKSSAYIQAWKQKKHSSIRFGIEKKVKWDNDKRTKVPKRNCDVYVFCLFEHKDKQTADPTNLNQWGFYIAPTKLLDEELGSQKTLTISTLEGLGLEKYYYKSIKNKIDNI